MVAFEELNRSVRSATIISEFGEGRRTLDLGQSY